MRIALKKFITREFLADKLGINANTLSRKMKEIEGITLKKRDLLTSKEVEAFFNHYKLDPNILGEDVADIHDYPYKKDLASNRQNGENMPSKEFKDA